MGFALAVSSAFFSATPDPHTTSKFATIPVVFVLEPCGNEKDSPR
jgi:hypothetical protein